MLIVTISSHTNTSGPFVQWPTWPEHRRVLPARVVPYFKSPARAGSSGTSVGFARVEPRHDCAFTAFCWTEPRTRRVGPQSFHTSVSATWEVIGWSFSSSQSLYLTDEANNPFVPLENKMKLEKFQSLSKLMKNWKHEYFFILFTPYFVDSTVMIM